MQVSPKMAEKIQNLRYANSESVKIEFEFNGHTITLTPPNHLLIVEYPDKGKQWIADNYWFLLAQLTPKGK